MKKSHRLFEDLADRYDLHTPSSHYEHDHEFVLSTFGHDRHRILDVGCGTGVLIEKALQRGFDAHGIDIAAGMVREACKKVGTSRVHVGAMEDIVDEDAYDGICALSWVINYVEDARSAQDIIARFHKALRPGGVVLIQTAHAPNMKARVFEDRERGPNGLDDDIVFLFQFCAKSQDAALARYVYASKSLGELEWEEHSLNVANAETWAGICTASGFTDVRIFGSWKEDELAGSISPWVVATKFGL